MPQSNDPAATTWYDFAEMARDGTFYTRLSIFYGSYCLRTDRLAAIRDRTRVLLAVFEAEQQTRGGLPT